MAHIIAFDTLALAKELETAGYPASQAEAQSRILANLLHTIEKARFEELATKQDIKELDARIALGLAEAKRDIEELRSELKRDIEELRTELKRDIEELRNELKRGIKELELTVSRDLARVAANLEIRMKELEADNQHQFLNLKRDMRETEMRLTLRLGGLMMVAVGAFATIVKLL